MQPSPVRVYLAEDHELVRAGLRLLIEAQPDLCVVGEASDGVAAYDGILELAPDVAVVDLSMPRMNGIELTGKLRALLRPPAILTLTANEDAAYLRQLFQLGVSGYLLKRSAADELIDALRAVARGDRFVGANLIGLMVDQLTSPSPPPDPQPAVPTENLSEREQAVLRKIAEGLTNREIAEHLEISIKTVETYKVRAMQKANLEGRAGIVRYAVARGWLRSS